MTNSYLIFALVSNDNKEWPMTFGHSILYQHSDTVVNFLSHHSQRGLNNTENLQFAKYIETKEINPLKTSPEYTRAEVYGKCVL